MIGTRRKPPVSYDRLDGARITLGWLFRLRLDWGRLDDGEVKALCDLLDAARVERGVNLDLLDAGDRATLERLAAKGAGLPENHFDQEREAATMAHATAEREARRRKLPISRRQQGTLFGNIFLALQGGDLWLDDVAALGLVLSMFASGQTFTASAYFEGVGGDAVLVFDAAYGLRGATDGLGHLDGIDGRLDYLAEERWIELEKHGPRRRLRLGEKLRSVFEVPEAVTA